MTALGLVDTAAGTYVVRRARPADVPALVALLATDAVAATRGDSVDDLAPYERAFAVIDADPGQLLVCLDGPDGVTVGTLQLTVVPGLSRSGATRAQIESVRVASGVRGAGLGTGFVRWAIDWARGQGCGLVQLTTDGTRHDAHRFYARLGFEQPTSGSSSCSRGEGSCIRRRSS
jgi:GNAT superfamily N-acetyltransferase